MLLLLRLVAEHFCLDQRSLERWVAWQSTANLSFGPATAGPGDSQGTLIVMHTLALTKYRGANQSLKARIAMEAGTGQVVAQKHQWRTNSSATAESL